MWHQWTLPRSRWLNASFGPYFSPLFQSWLQAVWVKLHLWVSQPHSVYFCIWRKGDGLEEGGGVWGKANSEGLNTQSKHYPMFELHTLSPTVLPHTRTPPLQPAQLNTLLIPGPAHKSDRKSTSDKVSPPQPAGFSWQRWLTCGLLWNKWSNFPNNHLRG